MFGYGQCGCGGNASPLIPIAAPYSGGGCEGIGAGIIAIAILILIALGLIFC